MNPLHVIHPTTLARLVSKLTCLLCQVTDGADIELDLALKSLRGSTHLPTFRVNIGINGVFSDCLEKYEDFPKLILDGVMAHFKDEQYIQLIKHEGQLFIFLGPQHALRHYELYLGLYNESQLGVI